MPNGPLQAVLKLSGQLRRLLVGLYVYAIQTGTGLVSRPVTIGLVAQRITRLTTDQKIAGSNPAEIEFISILEVSQ